MSRGYARDNRRRPRQLAMSGEDDQLALLEGLLG